MRQEEDFQTVSAALNRLFRTYPSFQAAEVAETLRVYFEALEPYDVRDIEAAVRSFITGSAPGHNPAFAPSAPQVGGEVRRQMNLRLDIEARERAMRPRLLPPLIEHTPEERDRVDQLVQDLVERNRASNAEYWASTRERFAPDMAPDAVRRRLRISVGDPDGDLA